MQDGSGHEERIAFWIDAIIRDATPIYDRVLSDHEIVAVLSWIKAQWPPDVRTRHDEINEAARKSGM